MAFRHRDTSLLAGCRLVGVAVPLPGRSKDVPLLMALPSPSSSWNTPSSVAMCSCVAQECAKVLKRCLRRLLTFAGRLCTGSMNPQMMRPSAQAGAPAFPWRHFISTASTLSYTMHMQRHFPVPSLEHRCRLRESRSCCTRGAAAHSKRLGHRSCLRMRGIYSSNGKASSTCVRKRGSAHSRKCQTTHPAKQATCMHSSKAGWHSQCTSKSVPLSSPPCSTQVHRGLL